MFKRKTRSISTTQKIRSSQGVPRMTVHHRNEETREACFPTVSPSTKNHWPVMDNDSASWDRNSRATSSSWPGEMEEIATRKILQLWYAIERNIYGESEETSSSSQLSEECTQWKSQLLHLRLVGKGANSYLNEANNNGTVRSNSRRSETDREDRYSEEIFMEDSVYRSEELSEDTRQRRLIEDQKEVFDQVLEHVCNELVKQSDENRDSLGKDLDEVLRITPAPTYSGRKWTNGRKKRDNPESRRSSANGNKSGLKKTVETADIVSTEKNRLETDNSQVNETEVAPVARNKLGTVFNEKIVVSPVPFVVSSRESFTTLRTTPISFRAHHFKLASSEGLGRYMNSASMTGQRIAPSRLSQIHSAWQAPVCPTVWPKNIKLAPIDPARLPSSKNRSSIDSMAALPHRNRNSLSPILRPIKPASTANHRNNDTEGLEIQGKQIITRSPKKNLPKTGWDCSPRNLKNLRTKTRIAKR